MDKITIRAFRATDDQERCNRFMREHTKVLTDIGVAQVIKPDDAWTNDHNTVVIVAEHSDLGMVGGIRLEGANSQYPLKMETCLKGLDVDVSREMNELREYGNAELCGLWNASRFAGNGVPLLVLTAAISVANQMAISSVVTFIAEYVAPYAERTGFSRMAEIGDNGDLAYPIAGIKTRAMILSDVLTLSYAQLRDRHRLMSLRTKPRQTRLENTKKDLHLMVQYDLILDAHMVRRFDLILHQQGHYAA